MAALGRLVAELALDSAQFTEGLKRAEKGFADFERSIGKAATGALTSFAGQLLAIETASRVADAAIKSFTETVKGLAALDDAAEKTGATVESLAKLQAQAKISGQAFEGIESALIKLNKGLSGSEDETKGAGKALEFLGIKAKDAQGNLRDSGEITLEVAKKLSEFSDKGPGKAALAMDLFGKSGAQLLPLFKDMASNAQELENVFVGNTEAADQYEKSMARLALQSEQLRRVVVSEILPAINDFLTAILNLKKEGDGLQKTIADLAADGSLAKWARDATIAIGETIDSIVVGINQFRALHLEVAALAQGAKGALDLLAAGAARAAGDYGSSLKLFAEADDRFAKARELSAKASELAATKYSVYTTAISQQAGAFDDARDRALKGAAATGELTKKTAEYTTSVKAAGKAISETTVLQKALTELFNKLENPDVDSALLKQTELLAKAFQVGAISAAKYADGLALAIAQSKTFADDQKKIAEGQAAINKALAQETETYLKGIDDQQAALDALFKSLDAENEKLNDEVKALGLVNAEREIYNINLAREKALKLAMSQSDVDRINKLYDEKIAIVGVKQAHEDNLSALERYKQIEGGIQDFFEDLFQNGRDAFANLGNTIKQFFAKLAAQFATKFVLNIVAGGVSGGLGGIASALGLGGGDSSGGLDIGGIGSLLGAGSSLLGGTGFAAAGGVFSSVLAGTGSVLQGLTAGLSALTGGATAFLGVLGPIGLAVGAIFALWKAFGADEKGFKFDNSLLTGDNRKGIISSSLGNFDFAGDFENKLVEPFISAINRIDDVFAKDLFNAQTLADVKDQIQNLVNPDWYGGNSEEEIKANIEAASKQFLQARYGVAFDALEAGAGNLVRSFAGTADELIQYIVKLQGAAVAIEKLNKIVPGLNLSLAGFAALSDSAREAVAVLAVSIEAFSTDTSKAVEDYIEASTRGVVASYELQAAKLAEMRDQLADGTIGIETFASGITALATAYASATAKIAETKTALAELFGNTQEGFFLQTLGVEQKYKYFQDQAEALFAALGSATDPETIDRLARQIDALQNSAFGLLSDADKTALSGQFISGSKAVEELVLQRLQAAGDALDKQNNNLKTVIADALADFAAQIKETADLDRETALIDRDTALTPRQLEITVKNDGNVEVRGNV
jgi:hypothetical protein